MINTSFQLHHEKDTSKLVRAQQAKHRKLCTSTIVELKWFLMCSLPGIFPVKTIKLWGLSQVDFSSRWTCRKETMAGHPSLWGGSINETTQENHRLDRVLLRSASAWVCPRHAQLSLAIFTHGHDGTWFKFGKTNSSAELFAQFTVCLTKAPPTACVARSPQAPRDAAVRGTHVVSDLPASQMLDQIRLSCRPAGDAEEAPIKISNRLLGGLYCWYVTSCQACSAVYASHDLTDQRFGKSPYSPINQALSVLHLYI